MENQHRQIKGYRELNELEIRLMNEVKQVGVVLEGLIQGLYDAPLDLDERWLVVGKTHLQEGLMALTRSIAQPTFF